MKRIVSLALICVVLFLCLVPSAFANEVDSSGLVEVLDTTLPNDGDTLKVYRELGAGSLNAHFNLNTAGTIYYMDIIFVCPSGQSPSTVYLSRASNGAREIEFQVINIFGDTYRAFGETNYTPRGFYLVFGNVGWVEFKSVRVSYSPVSGSDETGKCILMAYGYNATINFVPTDSINHRSFSGASDPELNYFDAYITPDNWQKYDFIDVTFQADISSINSINAMLGDSSIPFTVSYLDNDGLISNHYEVCVRLDLRNIDRTSDEWFYIHIEGQVISGSSENLFGILGLRGFVVSYAPNPILRWLRSAYAAIANGFSQNHNDFLNLFEILRQPTTSGDQFKDDSSGLVSDLDGMASSMDSVDRPAMDSLDVDFSGDISDASVLMSGLFTEVTSVPWLSTIILASCSLGLLSYVLFGKD